MQLEEMIAKTKDVCPCPNLACGNKGNCYACTSAHLARKSPNGCAFYMMKDFLLQVAAADPQSKAGQMAKEFVDKREAGYAETMKKFNLTCADMKKRLEGKAAGVK
jgi:hypothetical protein